jgi:hypothetical protein
MSIARYLRNAQYRSWFHCIETHLPSGKSSVVVTTCTRRSVEEIKISLQKNRLEYSPHSSYVYSIDSTPVYEPNRRCDICKCQ